GVEGGGGDGGLLIRRRTDIHDVERPGSEQVLDAGESGCALILQDRARRHNAVPVAHGGDPHAAEIGPAAQMHLACAAAPDDAYGKLSHRSTLSIVAFHQAL